MRSFPPASPETRTLLGQLGAQRRHFPDKDHSDIVRDAAASRLADHARHIVENAPPLTGAQIDRLSTILRGGTSR